MRSALVLVAMLVGLLAPRDVLAATALVHAIDPVTTPEPSHETLALAPGTTLDVPALRVRTQGGAASAAADTSGNFEASPGSAAFAEVSAYFHAARTVAFFAALGLERAPLEVVVGGDLAGALYVPASDPAGGALRSASLTTRDLVILGRTDAVDLALDGPVVAHETAHAMLDGGARIHGWRATSAGLVHDPEAIAEALADYFAATVTGTPLLGAFAATDPALGPARDLRLPAPALARATAEAHRASSALSAPLWHAREEASPDVRTALDGAIARVARRSWPEQPTFAELTAALVAEGVPLALDDEAAIPLAPNVALVSPAGLFVTAGTRDAIGDLAPGAFQVSVALPADARTLRGGLRFVKGAFPAVAIIAFDTPIVWDAAGRTGARHVPFDGDVFEVAIPPGATRAWVQVGNAGEAEGAFDALAVAFPAEDEPAAPTRPGGCGAAPSAPSASWALVLVCVLFRRRAR